VSGIALQAIRAHLEDHGNRQPGRFVATAHFYGPINSAVEQDLSSTHWLDYSLTGSDGDHRLCGPAGCARTVQGEPINMAATASLQDLQCSSKRMNGSLADFACLTSALLIHANPDDRDLAGAVTRSAWHATGVAPDVLVDLQGVTQGADFHFLSNMGGPTSVPGAAGAAETVLPGPIVLEAIGFWTTTGHSSAHYTVTDAVTVPVECAMQRAELAWFTESLILLPRAHQPPAGNYARPHAASEMESARRLLLSRLGSQADAPGPVLIIGALASERKLTESVTIAWARALVFAQRQHRPQVVSAHGTGSCRVVLVVRRWGRVNEAGAVRDSSTVGAMAVAMGFRRDCVAGGGSPKSVPEYLRLLRGIDVILDSPGYGSHTTAVDAISQACLVLAWRGGLPQGRLPSSIAAEASQFLSGAFVAESARDMAVVVQWAAANPAAVLKARVRLLQDSMKTLFNHTHYAKAWNAAVSAAAEVRASQATGSHSNQPTWLRTNHTHTAGSLRRFWFAGGLARGACLDQTTWRPLHLVIQPQKAPTKTALPSY
jgi:hypothetical protein